MMRNSISLARVSHPRAAPLRSPSFGPHSLHLLTGWPSAAVTGSGPAANDPKADVRASQLVPSLCARIADFVAPDLVLKTEIRSGNPPMRAHGPSGPKFGRSSGMAKATNASSGRTPLPYQRMR